MTNAVLWKIQSCRQTVHHRYDQFRQVQNSVCAGHSEPYLIHKSGSVFSGIPDDEWLTPYSKIITVYSFMVYLMILSVAHPLNGRQLVLMNWKKMCTEIIMTQFEAGLLTVPGRTE